MKYKDVIDNLRNLGFIIVETDHSSQKFAFDIQWPESSICICIPKKLLDQSLTVEEQICQILGEYIKEYEK